MADDLDLSDVVEVLAWAALGYVVLNFFRNASVTDQGELVFPGSEPSQDIIGQTLDILSPMKISPTGEAFIKQEEGLRLVPYPDGHGGHSGGYGHYWPPGSTVPARLTNQQAEDLFAGDSATAAAAVNNAITVQVTQNQFDAMGSLAFNIGAGAFANSQLVRDLNAGDFQAASNDFMNWTSHNQLAARRTREQNVFNGGGGVAA